MIICCQLSYSNIQHSNREEESIRPPKLLNFSIIPPKCLRVFYVCNLIKIFLGLPLWRPLKPSKFRSSTSNRISPPMSPRSGGGESEILILSAIFPSFTYFRLSKENVTSIYDDRLDKVDPDGNLQPGQRRYPGIDLAHAANSIGILWSSFSEKVL